MNSISNLDSKYGKIYEDQIVDPFYIEELERTAVLSKLNIFEQSLAYVTKIFLQDSMMRKVLLFYLLLVHFFAIAYIVEVLNPQLIDELESFNRSKYTTYTMDFVNSIDGEHPDI